ncbi:C40 family peptidase [Arthrobacter globiformis]|uniref:C40 family peptidase n=1 Tax=Arthrobacter globiformis TaxID=1665 RepID=UPI00278D0117|nr:C40 family peptidase [Arthrobacter globiformis]MDQ0616642.1 cell wall-associated NlpC family hydrolase [Arthrobacter globiformis]
MSLTGPGRTAAVFCTAVVLCGTLAAPATADRAITKMSPTAGLLATALTVPASPEVPSPADIAAAKSSESATAAKVADIEGILADAATAQEVTFARTLEANNAYSNALVELDTRSDAAAVATARASAADKEQSKSRKAVGQLAGDLYRNGGLNPELSGLVTGTGDVLAKAATLQALTAGRSRAFTAAETTAAAAESLTAAAADARRAADDAAKTAETLKAEADHANAAQVKAVADAKAQRTVLVGQLASLRNTTAALESARVDGLERQRQQARLAAVTAAAEGAAAAQAATDKAAAANAAAAGSASAASAEESASAPSRTPAQTAPSQAAPAAPPQAAPAPPAPAPVRPAPAPARPAPAPAQPAPVPPAPAPARAPAQPAPAPVQPAPSPGGSNMAAISVAMGKVGSPYFYQYGGTGAYGFDCSGLVQNAFAAIGKQLPRTAAEQFAQAPVHVPLSQAQPGDLLVWGSAPGFYHVAIYLGGGRVVQALNPSAGITVTDLSMMAGMQLHPVAARY